MMRKRRSENRRFGFEHLEDRRLLAADCGMQIVSAVEVAEPAQCEVAPAELPAADVVADELTVEETPAFSPAVVGEASPVMESTASTEAGVIDSVDTAVASEGALDPRVFNLDDGMDGYFGTLNADNPAETIEFTASADGMIDVVVASSFAEGHTVLSVSDSAGNVIETAPQGLEGFDVLSFEVSEGESYQLLFASTDAQCDGHFQMTAGFEPFVDQHADVMGAESTVLQFDSGESELTGRLEQPGDIDTFRFTAGQSGEMTLELNETVADSRINLNASVHDAAGNVLATGSTNQMLQLTFDAENGAEYFLAIEAGEGQKGTYSLEVKAEAVTEPVAEPVAVESPDTSTDPAVETGAESELDVADQPVEAESDETDTDSVVDEASPVEGNADIQDEVIAVDEFASGDDTCDTDEAQPATDAAEEIAAAIDEGSGPQSGDEVDDAISEPEESGDEVTSVETTTGIESVDDGTTEVDPAADSSDEVEVVQAEADVALEEDCDETGETTAETQPEDIVVDAQPEEQVAVGIEDETVEISADAPTQTELDDAWVDVADNASTTAIATTESETGQSETPVEDVETPAPATSADLADTEPEAAPEDCVFGQEAIDEFFSAISEDHDFEFSFTRGPHTLGFIPFFSTRG